MNNVESADTNTNSNSSALEQKCNIVQQHHPSILSRPTAPPVASASNPSTKEHDFELLINAISPMGLDLSEMATDQPLDLDFVRLSNDARSGLNFKRIELNGKQLIVDVSNGPARPFVPYNWRRRIFDTIHNLGHPGVERTRQTIADKFFWPTLREDTSRWARECQPCQMAKINRHVTPPIGEFAVPERRFSHVNLDIVGPLPVSNGHRYLLTAVDRFTRWPMAVPMRDISAESVIEAFSYGWVSNYGIPSSITTDRGSQFLSAVWNQLMATWSIKTHQTTAYHPAANGLVERFHRRLKESLIAISNHESVNWYWKLPCTLLSIRTTLKPDIGASPADLVYGEGLSVPGSLIPSRAVDDNSNSRRQLLDHLRLEVARLQPTDTSAHRSPRIHVPESLAAATHVFVLRGGHQPALTSPYMGPFRVVSRGQDSYRIALPGRGIDSVNISRLKPAVVAQDDDGEDVPPDTPPSPPPPGRRPGPRTRPPAPTDRTTRRRVHFAENASSSSATSSQTAVTAAPSSSASSPSSSSTSAPPVAPQEDVRQEVVAPSDERLDNEPFLAPHPPLEEAPVPRQAPRFFTRPNERHFSRQRPHTSYKDVLSAILSGIATDRDVVSSSGDGERHLGGVCGVSGVNASFD